MTAAENSGRSPPAMFSLVDLGPGFSLVFGPVYSHAMEPKMGFFVAPHHVNPVNACHGGAIATFADMLVRVVNDGAGGIARHTPTISMSIDYVSTAKLGSWVEAQVSLVKKTRTMLFMQSLITANGDIVARTSAIYRHYPRTEKPSD